MQIAESDDKINTNPRNCNILHNSSKHMMSTIEGGCRGHDRMVVIGGFTTTHAFGAYSINTDVSLNPAQGEEYIIM